MTGSIRFNTSPAATGRMVLYKGLTTSDRFHAVPNLRGFFRVFPQTLGATDDHYHFVVGLCDVLSTFACVDGVWFEYKSDVSANWRRCTASDSTGAGGVTCTSSATAVTAAQTVLRFEVNNALTSVRFFVGATDIGENTTHIPPTTGARASKPLIGLRKISGATNRQVHVTYYGLMSDQRP